MYMYAPLGLENTGVLDFWILVFWIFRLQDLWISGSLDAWVSASLNLSISGPLGIWISGFLDLGLDLWISGFASCICSCRC